jgi:mRNA interferase RelE/StbE
MTYAITFRPKAGKEFFSLPKHVRIRLEARLEALSQDPRAGDTTKLKARSGAIRLRVGGYRVLYVVDHGARVINVLKVGPRGSVYK